MERLEEMGAEFISNLEMRNERFFMDLHSIHYLPWNKEEGASSTSSPSSPRAKEGFAAYLETCAPQSAHMNDSGRFPCIFRRAYISTAEYESAMMSDHALVRRRAFEAASNEPAKNGAVLANILQVHLLSITCVLLLLLPTNLSACTAVGAGEARVCEAVGAVLLC